MSDFSQMLSYHVIYSLPWEYHSTIMVLSECPRYYPAVMIYHFFVKLEKSKITTKTKPNFVNYAGGLWQRWEWLESVLHPPSPPLDYDPRMRLTSFWNLGELFPLVTVLGSLCPQNWDNWLCISFTDLYWDKMIKYSSFLGAINNLSRILRSMFSWPAPPPCDSMYCHPCCSYLLAACHAAVWARSTATHYNLGLEISYHWIFCGKLTEMAATKQTKIVQPTPNQCHAPENNY